MLEKNLCSKDCAGPCEHNHGCDAGAVQACITDTQSSTIKFKNPNKEWRAPHLLQDSKDQGVGETDSDGEADDRWLEAAEEARKQHE